MHNAISSAYKEIVHWERSKGKEFIFEMTSLGLYSICGEILSGAKYSAGSVMTMPALLLQKPHIRSKAKDHIHCLKRFSQDMVRRQNQ